MKDISPHISSIVAIVMIGFIEYTAITHGIDGKMMAASIAIIAGLGGFSAATIFNPPTQ